MKIVSMNCPNCGAVMNEDTIFCTNCGTKIGNEQGDYKIVVTRPKKLFGVAISFKILIDGVEIGKLSNGVTLERMVTAGSHIVAVKSLEKTLEQEVVLSDENKEVTISVSIGFGIVAGRPKIDSVTYK